MNTSEYATMASRERSYWWHVGRLKIINTYVKHLRIPNPLILNIGCGTGGTIDMLEGFGVTDNVDVSDEAIRFMEKCGYKRITKVDGIKLPFKARTYDIVGAFDVLEHIDDHIGALKEWRRVIKDDGAIIITVPAYQWLWSDHDVSLHHKRRYTINTLIKAAEEAGLEPVKKSYAIVFSTILVIGFRCLRKILGQKSNSETSYVNVPNWVNYMFTQLLYAESWLHNFLSFPFGTSVIATLKKSK